MKHECAPITAGAADVEQAAMVAMEEAKRKWEKWHDYRVVVSAKC